ncbi:hypothetical protein ADL03_15985 [Nocardia sp. NRRL S-836]|nr:hypothetical protein ADL03_15985 [Nocardia sp. NRRL S-836]
MDRVTVLHGNHTSAETAYVVEDAQYGNHPTKRCQIRYWIETAETGRYKGEQRFVYQTSNPDKPGEWFKEKRSIFSHMVLLVRSAADAIEGWHISMYQLDGPEEYRHHLSGVYEQLTDQQRSLYDHMRARVWNRSPRETQREVETLAHVMDHIIDTGYNPVVDDGWWIKPDRTKWLYLGLRDNPEVRFAYARTLLAG